MHGHDTNAQRRAVMRPARPSRQSGFTLIELAITCVVIGILAAMAITSYEFATIKSRRASAQACLTEAAQILERYHTTHMSYAGGPAPTCPDLGEHYKVTFQNDTAPTDAAYVIEAIPQGRQADKEKDCGTMTIDQAGRRTPATGCW